MPGDVLSIEGLDLRREALTPARILFWWFACKQTEATAASEAGDCTALAFGLGLLCMAFDETRILLRTQALTLPAKASTSSLEPRRVRPI